MCSRWGKKKWPEGKSGGESLGLQEQSLSRAPEPERGLGTPERGGKAPGLLLPS